MKKSFLIVLIALLAIAAKSQTYISGFISPNMTWTVAGSPYIVTGNALLMQNDTLTIDPGVTVKFDPSTTLQIDGYLIAIGTASNRITFTSNQAAPQAGDWDELHFSDYSSDAIFDSSGNYLSGCILKYCDVLYGGNGDYGLIHIESSSPYISQCTVQHSNTSGIYSNISSIMPDSSTVNDCQDYGIYFSGCGAKVINDSINNNLKGGLYLTTNCGITIKNSSFSNNSLHGAIYSPNEINNSIFVSHNYFDNNEYNNYTIHDIAIITLKSDTLIFDGNYFINNLFSGTTAGSLISLRTPLTGIDTTSALWFTNNYIGDNSAINGSFIMFANYFHSSIISGNSFINNSVGDYTSAIAGIYSCINNTIECNLFQNNQSGNNAYGALSVYMQGPTIIRKNIFDGNHNNAANQTSVAHIDCISGGSDTCFFVNNTVRNNLSPLGPCIEFMTHIINQQVLQIHDNNFENNNVNGVIKLSGNNTGNVNLDFVYIKHNNFSDPNSPSELYNNIPYGSPNVNADSNYWNGASNQHLDSVINDFFDDGNLSVVFYQPALTSPVIIDTTCTGISTIVTEATDNSVYSSYPNPFSNHTTVVFEKKLSDGFLTVFNRYGQEVKVMHHLKGYEIRVDRVNLAAGVYFYRVVDKSVTVGSGKLVIIE